MNTGTARREHGRLLLFHQTRNHPALRRATNRRRELEDKLQEITMDPESFLLVERVRARELREEAARRRKARLVAPASLISAFEEQLGWALVRTGLRLVDHHACRPHRSRLRSR